MTDEVDEHLIMQRLVENEIRRFCKSNDVTIMSFAYGLLIQFNEILESWTDEDWTNYENLFSSLGDGHRYIFVKNVQLCNDIDDKIDEYREKKQKG